MSPCVVPIYPIILVELSPKTIPTMNYTIIELVVIIALALYLSSLSSSEIMQIIWGYINDQTNSIIGMVKGLKAFRSSITWSYKSSGVDALCQRHSLLINILDSRVWKEFYKDNTYFKIIWKECSKCPYHQCLLHEMYLFSKTTIYLFLNAFWKLIIKSHGCGLNNAHFGSFS